MLAEVMGLDFESAAYKLMTKDGLVKLMHYGKHILAEIGTSAVISILNNVYSVKVVQRLAEEMKQSKSTYVKEKSAVFLYIILSTYPKAILQQLESTI